MLLHGGPGAHHEYLLPQCLELTDTHQLVTYDQRGGGRSKTDGTDTITATTHVADLGAVAAELITGPLTVIGYSWGGLLALRYLAAAQRDATLPRIKRLVLISPAPVRPEWRARFEQDLSARNSSDWVRAEREALAASGLRESDPAAHRQRGFELSVAGYFADPARARDLTPFRVTGRVQQSTWESLQGVDILGELADVRVPAVVIHGRQDPIPLASSQAVAAALGAELHVLDDCGHVPYVEASAPLFGVIRAFLGST
jgi:proline iminopeptidase